MNRERPILFTAPMVRAILAGTKTQTRRAVKPRHDWHVEELPDRSGALRPWPYFLPYVYAEPEAVEVPCPYGEPGDLLWVRETWGLHAYNDFTDWFDGKVQSQDDVASMWTPVYRADHDTEGAFWRPSIHMPRWASRISLRITDVRVERLQDISEEDAKAEGVDMVNGHPERGAFLGIGPCYREGFFQIWADINGPESWGANQWVWVLSFERVNSAPRLFHF